MAEEDPTVPASEPRPRARRPSRPSPPTRVRKTGWSVSGRRAVGTGAVGCHQGPGPGDEAGAGSGGGGQLGRPGQEAEPVGVAGEDAGEEGVDQRVEHLGAEAAADEAPDRLVLAARRPVGRALEVLGGPGDTGGVRPLPSGPGPRGRWVRPAAAARGTDAAPRSGHPGRPGRSDRSGRAGQPRCDRSRRRRPGPWVPPDRRPDRAPGTARWRRGTRARKASGPASRGRPANGVVRMRPPARSAPSTTVTRAPAWTAS